MDHRKGRGVLQEAKYLKAKEELRESKKPTPTWPPMEPLSVLQIKTFPTALLDDLKVLAVRKHKSLAEVAAQVVRAGLKSVDGSGDNLAYKPSGDVESG